MEIAKKIEDLINNTSCNPRRVAYGLSRMHRYLQNEFFKICFNYILLLNDHYKNGTYDGRNEWACKMANDIVTKALVDTYGESYLDGTTESIKEEGRKAS